MARRPAKAPGTSPNKALVILLVVFVLLSIGLGVWVYAVIKERDKWDVAAREEKKKVQEATQTADWYKFQTYEMFAAIGEPSFNQKPDLIKTWRENRDSFLSGSAFKNEEGDREFLNLMKLLADSSRGEFDEKEGRYKSKLIEQRPNLEAELGKVQKQIAAEGLKYNAKQQEFLALEKKYNADRDGIAEQIKKANAAALEIYKKNNDAMTQAFDQNDKLQKEIEKIGKDAKEQVNDKDNIIRTLTASLKKQQDIAQNPNRSLAEPHALVLDVSTGKALWDMPRAKIVRVDESGKRFYIDKGSKDGIKPGLTFNVFTGGAAGRGEGDLKATVEVIRVEDARTSLCKVNTFYDAAGREIAAVEGTLDKLFREGAGALKEGDLLFNLVWGTHVAIVGIVDFTGVEAKSPAAEMDNLKEFMRHLERVGVVIDAYTDPRDGKLVGEPTAYTNFVIRGQAIPKQKDGEDDKRAKAINAGIIAMRDQAIDRGMFIISPENFAAVTGYRRAGSADVQQILNFVPQRPAGPAPTGGGQPVLDPQKKD